MISLAPIITHLLDCGCKPITLQEVIDNVSRERKQVLRVLDKLAKEGELPIAEAVRILRDVVEALSHVHFAQAARTFNRRVLRRGRMPKAPSILIGPSIRAMRLWLLSKQHAPALGEDPMLPLPGAVTSQHLHLPATVCQTRTEAPHSRARSADKAYSLM